ncbi:uncharacterized protein PHACADRAFT_211186 [Phanerochaete carnosa HHB-10118-sp]|uniref:Uncharacterized protein n=1 Tax=Phanerochaete carnosa (strain HHB-10118-sp) TaxID=650164 RepID=K5W3J5_PHACS|nr:uncharacterized protein PHACADRAFT_211186 [Phanerochaete carnosa HHB-10118-sp]EKM53494.1 hypothetical protein PHACADRAFT_211186 [Phanerochaete carnosa HHB-10118-sp]
MSVAKVVQGYFAQRVVLTSPKPFSKVLAALDAEVNKENPHVKQILNGSKSKEEIEQGVGALTDSGKRNSIYVAPELSSAAPLTNTRDSRLFAADFYSRWLSVYYGKKLPDLALYTFGNPLFATIFPRECER